MLRRSAGKKREEGYIRRLLISLSCGRFNSPLPTDRTAGLAFVLIEKVISLFFFLARDVDSDAIDGIFVG